MLKKKKRCRGSNGVGYCPFPVLCHDTAVVSRREGRGVHNRCVCEHDKGLAHAGACQGRAIVTDLLGLSVVTELAHLVSRQSWLTLCHDIVGSPCVATRVFSVATGRWAAVSFGVATAALLCEAEVCCRRVFSVATRWVVWCRDRVRVTQRVAHAIRQCCLIACCTVMCNCLYHNALALFMKIVHGHCFKKKVQK